MTSLLMAICSKFLLWWRGMLSRRLQGAVSVVQRVLRSMMNAGVVDTYPVGSVTHCQCRSEGIGTGMLPSLVVVSRWLFLESLSVVLMVINYSFSCWVETLLRCVIRNCNGSARSEDSARTTSPTKRLLSWRRAAKSPTSRRPLVGDRRRTSHELKRQHRSQRSVSRQMVHQWTLMSWYVCVGPVICSRLQKFMLCLLTYLLVNCFNFCGFRYTDP